MSSKIFDKDFSRFLKIGDTLPIFNLYGKFPVLKDRLQKC